MAENYELKHQMPRPDLDDAPSDASDDAVDGPVDQVQLLRVRWIWFKWETSGSVVFLTKLVRWA